MKIKFLPSGQEIDINPNKSLLQLCTENGIEIKSICKGVPSCAECRVNIVSGEHNILPPSKAELSLIGTNYFIDSRRLSCQVRCFGDVTVDLTDQLARAESQTKKTRGFRAQKGLQTETHAKQGTLVLEEVDTKPEPQQQQPRNQGGGGQNRQEGGGQGQRDNRGGRGDGGQRQGGGGQQRQQQQQAKPKQQGQGGGSHKPQGGGNRPQQSGNRPQGQQQNQQKNQNPSGNQPPKKS